MNLSAAAPVTTGAACGRLVTVGELRLLVERDGERGWDAFARRYYPRLLSYGWRLTEDGGEAEDLVQRVMIRWYQVFTGRTDQLADDRPIFPWLARCLRNLWVDTWRRKHEQAVESLEAGEGQPAESELARVLFRLDQRECLQQRPALDQELLLRAAEGLSLRELERITGLSRGNLNRRFLQMKDGVKHCLERHGWTEAEVRRELCHG